jgi:hypothetical protein
MERRAPLLMNVLLIFVGQIQNAVTLMERGVVIVATQLRFASREHVARQSEYAFRPSTVAEAMMIAGCLTIVTELLSPVFLG